VSANSRLNKKGESWMRYEYHEQRRSSFGFTCNLYQHNLHGNSNSLTCVTSFLVENCQVDCLWKAAIPKPPSFHMFSTGVGSESLRAFQIQGLQRQLNYKHFPLFRMFSNASHTNNPSCWTKLRSVQPSFLYATSSGLEPFISDLIGG
jgi:hypothetical protein